MISLADGPAYAFHYGSFLLRIHESIRLDRSVVHLRKSVLSLLTPFAKAFRPNS